MSVDVARPFQHWSSISNGLAMTLDSLHTGVRCTAKWPYSMLTVNGDLPFAVSMLYGYTHSWPYMAVWCKV